MRTLMVATGNPVLLAALEETARAGGAALARPRDLDDLLGEAAARVLDPDCLPAGEWNAYLDDLFELEGEDPTPLVLLRGRHGASPWRARPQRIPCKPPGALRHCADTEVDAVCALVAAALPDPARQTPSCLAPAALEVEACWVASQWPEGHLVVVARPEDDAGFTAWGRLAARAGLEEDQWAAAAFLAFPFPSEEAARLFAACAPEGMASLYRDGACLEDCLMGEDR